MKSLLFFAAAVISCLAVSAQLNNPRLDYRYRTSTEKHQSSFPVINSSERSRTPADATTFDSTWANRFQTVLDSVMQATNAKGASVAVYTPEEGMWTGVSGTSNGWNPITPQMRFGVGSNTKLFIAVTMVRLQEEGILTLDDHLYQWLPSFQYVDSNTTIRQLLSHQSGIWDYWNDGPSLMFQIWADTSRFWTPEEIIGSIGPPHFAPGNGYRYSNTNYVLAGMIIEAATSETWTQKLHDIIFDPLNLDSTFVGAFEPRNGPVAAEWDGYWGHLITNSPMTAEFSQANANGAILATASEMVQWYNALFNGSIISDSSLQMVLTFDPTSLYGLGIQEAEPGAYIYYHTGGLLGYVSMIIHVPQRNATLCFLFNDRLSDFWAKVISIFNVFLNESPLRPNDAGITNISSPWEHYCSAAITPEVELQNFGSDPLTSVSVNYRIDQGETFVYDWVGSMDPGETVQLVLPSILTEDGAHEFYCYTSLPNGEPEGYTYNDGLQSNFFIHASTPALPGVFEGFDWNGFPQAGWTLNSSYFGQWGETSLARLDGTGAGVMNNYEGYGDIGDYYDLQLPLMNISGLDNTDFSFDYAYATYPNNNGDSLRVSVSEDCGTTWQTLFYDGGLTLQTAPSTSEIFYPVSPEEWSHESFPLNSYEGDILIRFRARFGYSNNLYIDNILVGSPVAVDEPAVGSSQFAVRGYPNPFFDFTTLEYELEHSANVNLSIYNHLGQQVAVLVNEEKTEGTYLVKWDAEGLPAGIYYYRLTTCGKIVKF